MAVVDYNNITSITRGKVLPKIIDQISDNNYLLKKLLDNAKLWNGGTDLSIPLFYRFNSQGGSYSGLDILNTAKENTRTRGIYYIKQIYQPIAVSNIERAQNAGPERVASIMEAEMEEAKKSLEDKFGTQLYADGTGNDNKDITGLAAVIDTDNTYAGIDRTSYSWFQANATASVGSFMASDAATMYDSCDQNNKAPNLIVTTKTIWSAYEATLTPQVRFMAQNGGYNTGDGGMKALSFRATPVVKDDYCPSGHMKFLNTEFLTLYYMKHPDWPTDARGFAVSDMVNPSNQDGKIGFIFNYCQLVCDQPRTQGVLTDVTA